MLPLVDWRLRADGWRAPQRPDVGGWRALNNLIKLSVGCPAVRHVVMSIVSSVGPNVVGEMHGILR